MKKILPPLIIISLICGYFVFDQIKVKRFFKKLDQEFPAIQLSKSYSGSISKIYTLPYWIRRSPNYSYVFLSDSSKITLHTSLELKGKVTLQSVLKVGDQIRKEGGNNLLSVIRINKQDTLIYLFELLDNSERPLK